METNESIRPQARKDGLIIREVGVEFLVYDLLRDRAHCLNQTSASVWKLCDGRKTVAEMTRRLQEELQTAVDPQLVWLALDQLQRSDLLQEKIGTSKGSPVTRREVMRRLGKTTVVSLPVIASLIAPTPAQAQTPCAQNGDPCTTDADCCSNFCKNGQCQACPPNNPHCR